VMEVMEDKGRQDHQVRLVLQVHPDRQVHPVRRVRLVLQVRQVPQDRPVRPVRQDLRGLLVRVVARILTKVMATIQGIMTRITQEKGRISE
jgi:hypothetical protein